MPDCSDQPRATRPSVETLDLLANRRSTLARHLTAPGPGKSELDDLLRLAARVPDHGRLGPWRFIVFTGDARVRFGEELARIVQKQVPAAEEKRLGLERGRLTRAPVVVCVVSNVTYGHKIPVWEQELSAGAVCQNMLIAAHAMGYAGQWVTEWCSANPLVDAVLGLGRNERIAGFIYLGTASVEPTERPRPDWRDRTSHF
ncbi:Nitroreductase family protein [Candidatus Phaeomarinobacter ectocarpi]|uniref:Putative NAD(P)H nitroreductase n=1 Tax=Candidatus Phaeomarinibacter ectocarpi TaxID=1458461 RepID=X5MNC0_9HYPH|nr:Nitroreductase family protein [Candidatus Phaeomarinobacter ectocarpi]